MAAELPNVVVIAADGLKATALGCYGNEQVKTPNLDGLASDSTFFEFALVQSPSALPSYASLMTGRFPQCHGLLHLDCQMAAGEVLFADVLGASGYWTGSIGWMPDIPEYPGWGFRNLRDADAFPKEEASKLKAKHLENIKGTPLEHVCGVSGLTASDHPTSRLTDKALAVLKELAGKPEKPFLLCVTYSAPRYPCLPPREYADMYPPGEMSLPANFGQPPYYGPCHAAMTRERIKADFPVDPSAIKTYVARYYAEISLLDHNVGRILKIMGDLGLSENTIVVFTSLQGDFAGEHGAIMDGDVYDPCVRVPLMIRFTQAERRGKRIGSYVEQTDIMPTLLTAAGLEVPPKVQGLSLVDLIDKGTYTRRRFVSSMLQDVHMPNGRYLARSKFTALIEDDYMDRMLLFDMREDPLQVENMAMRPENQGLIHTYSLWLQSRFQGDYQPASEDFLPKTMRTGVANTDFPEGVKIISNVVYGNDNPRHQVLDVYIPPAKGPTPVLIEFHGGGFRGGDKLGRERTYPGLFGTLLQNGIACVAANYRLRPEYTMDDIHADGARVIQYVREHASQWNMDPSRVALAGGSAGAMLSGWLALHDDLAKPESDDPLERQSTRVSAWICHWGSAPTEFVSPDDPPAFMLFAGPDDLTGADDPRLAPVAHSPLYGFLLEKAFKAHGVPYELHVVPDLAAKKEHFNNLRLEFLKKAFNMR